MAQGDDAASLLEWIERHGDRITAEQQLARNSSLVIVTFSEAFAATLVATALQVDKVHWLVVASCVALGVGFGILLSTVFLERTAIADEAQILGTAKVEGWSASRTLRELRTVALTSVEHNKSVVAAMRRAVLAQVLVCIAASALAVLSVLLGD